jgi:hypothetical protein
MPHAGIWYSSARVPYWLRRAASTPRRARWLRAACIDAMIKMLKKENERLMNGIMVKKKENLCIVLCLDGRGGGRGRTREERS